MGKRCECMTMCVGNGKRFLSRCHSNYFQQLFLPYSFLFLLPNKNEFSSSYLCLDSHLPKLGIFLFFCFIIFIFKYFSVFISHFFFFFYNISSRCCLNCLEKLFPKLPVFVGPRDIFNYYRLLFGGHMILCEMYLTRLWWLASFWHHI